MSLREYFITRNVRENARELLNAAEARNIWWIISWLMRLPNWRITTYQEICLPEFACRLGCIFRGPGPDRYQIPNQSFRYSLPGKGVVVWCVNILPFPAAHSEINSFDIISSRINIFILYFGPKYTSLIFFPCLYGKTSFHHARSLQPRSLLNQNWRDSSLRTLL